MSQLEWLQSAVQRLHDPRTDWTKFNKREDEKNVAYAQEKWIISRDKDWYIIYRDPTKSWSSIDPEKVITWSSLNDWQNSSRMLEDLQKLIKRKEEILQPTTEEEAMWRWMIKDTTPFWATRDNTFYETVPRWASFDNANFRELSPEDQASVRASRDAAAEAHLKSIANEREYIWDSAASTIKSLAESINAKIELEAAKIKAAAAAAEKSIFSNSDKKSIAVELWLPIETVTSLSDDDLSDLYAMANSDVVKTIKTLPVGDNQKRAIIDWYISDQTWNELNNLISVLWWISDRAKQQFEIWIWLIDKPTENDTAAKIFADRFNSVKPYSSSSSKTSSYKTGTNPYSIKK